MPSPTDKRVIFIVVDPTQDEPLALLRALIVTKIASENKDLVLPKIHVFIAVDHNNTDTSSANPAMHRSGQWLYENIVNPLIASGLEHSFEFSWSSDWYGSIVSESQRHNLEMIMLPMVKRPSNHERLFSDSIWHLLRTAQCPITLVQPGSSDKRKVILAAVNYTSDKPEYKRLNDLIIQRGQGMVDYIDADLHIVNAYKDSLNYPDRTRIANESKVDRTKIHVRSGDPEAVIADVAKEISADVVLLGIQHRTNRWRGNTAEKIITKVGCDVMTIN